jgi:hypothetical protein
MIAAPVKPIKVAQDSAPIFTIHQSHNNVMGVRLRGRPEVKTCVVSFSNHTDALRMARMVEHHRLTHQEWPNFNFDDQNDNILRLVGGNDETMTLQELTIFEWPSLHDISIFCAFNFLDLMKLRRIRQRKGDSFSLEGDIHKLQLDFEGSQKRFDDIFQIETSHEN